MAEITLAAMTTDDIDEVLSMEKLLFSDAWSRDSFVSEVTDDNIHWPRVARSNGVLIGYLVVWFIVNEAHIANVAIKPDWRRQGLATRFINEAIAEGRRRGTRRIDLEVRQSNIAARELYGSLGFRPTGTRKRYYADNHEDALLMCLLLESESKTAEDTDCPGLEK